MARDPREVLSRPAPPPDATLRYGEHPEHVIDLWLPAREGPTAHPLVVFLHGGFWRARFDRRHTGPLAAALAVRGHPVASVEYRRVGMEGGGWSGTLDDVEQALDAVPELVEPALVEAHVDPGGYVLAGHSAGGHLALLNADKATGVVALAPVADLEYAHATGLGDGAVADFLGGGPAELPDRYERADPVRHAPPSVPTVIVHGDADDVVPVEVSRRYARHGGDRCRLRVLPGGDHFGVIDPLSAAWPFVVEALTEVVDG